MISAIFHRIRSDYFLSSRLREYELLLRTAIHKGYQHQTLTTFFRAHLAGTASSLLFLHRHDIDTDPDTARRFFEIEQRLGVRSSFYFRRSTLDIPLMKEIHAYGSEVGYHYEELATVCKRKNITNASKVVLHYPEIRQELSDNFNQLKDQLGFPMTSIASHGDFANRKLGIPNHAVVDELLLQSLGVELECYDQRLLTAYSVALSDTLAPHFYKPYSPFQALNDNNPIIFLLTHPRHWHCAPLWNTRENLTRLIEGWKFRN